MKPAPMLPVIMAAILFTFVEARPPAADGPYQLIKDVPIGGDGGWDYLNVDPGARRLYISHASKVVVYDMTTDAIIGEIADTPGIHGAVPGPGGRVFTSNGRENKASIVDSKTFQTITKVDTGGNPDFMLMMDSTNGRLCHRFPSAPAWMPRGSIRAPVTRFRRAAMARRRLGMKIHRTSSR